jgi:hypothetical protein
VTIHGLDSTRWISLNDSARDQLVLAVSFGQIGQ